MEGLNALDSLLYEATQFIGGGCCKTTYETRQHKGGVGATIHVEIPLTASTRFDLSTLAIEHARDVNSFMRAVVDEYLKPFDEKVKRAGCAACAAWQAVMDGR